MGRKLKWDRGDIDRYMYELSHKLSSIYIPSDALTCHGDKLNDKLYEHLCNKNDIEFWKAWRKRFCTRNEQPTGILNGQTGSDNVRNEFTNYYKDVFQPNNLGADKKYKDLVPGATSNADIIAPQTALVDVGILQDCITGLKFNKTPGYDGICNEHNYEVWWRSISGSFVLVV